MSIQLTIEQEFAIAGFQESIKYLSEEEVKAKLVDLYVELMYREARYISLLGKAWGMTSEP